MKGGIFLISGTMGSGKDRVLTEMKERFLIHTVLGSTTRPPRPGEKNEVSYRFFSKSEFKKKIREGLFEEHSNVHNFLYGILKSDFNEALREKKNIFIKTDEKGAAKLKKVYPDAISIFIAPPSLGTIKKRIVGRNMDPKIISKRLEAAENELGNVFKKDWDFILVNKNIEKTITRLSHLLK